MSNEEQIKIALDVWKVAQEQQKTFNDLLFRIRNIAFVFAGAVVAGTGTLVSKNEPAGYLLLFASIPWVSLYLLDRYYYHLLLRAAVQVSSEIEAKFLKEYDIPALAATITSYNRNDPIPFTKATTGREKVTIFYGLPLTVNLAVATYLISKNNYLTILILLLVVFIFYLLEKQSSCRNQK